MEKDEEDEEGMLRSLRRKDSPLRWTVEHEA
jgi:hypothetical protein